MRPHSTAVKFIKNYARQLRRTGQLKGDLDIEFNPNCRVVVTDPQGRMFRAIDESIKFMVVQERIVSNEIPGLESIVSTRKVRTPVLFVPDASCVNYRWIKALEQNRLRGSAHRFVQQEDERLGKIKKKYLDYTEDFAKDHHKLWLKKADKVGVANKPLVDPIADRKRWEDKHGRKKGGRLKVVE